MSKTSHKLPPDKLLKRILAVAQLLATPSHHNQQSDKSASHEVTPIVNQNVLRGKTNHKNHDNPS